MEEGAPPLRAWPGAAAPCVARHHDSRVRASATAYLSRDLVCESRISLCARAGHRELGVAARAVPLLQHALRLAATQHSLRIICAQRDGAVAGLDRLFPAVLLHTACGQVGIHRVPDLLILQLPLAARARDHADLNSCAATRSRARRAFQPHGRLNIEEGDRLGVHVGGVGEALRGEQLGRVRFRLACVCWRHLRARRRKRLPALQVVGKDARGVYREHLPREDGTIERHRVVLHVGNQLAVLGTVRHHLPGARRVEDERLEVVPAYQGIICGRPLRHRQHPWLMDTLPLNRIRVLLGLLLGLGWHYARRPRAPTTTWFPRRKARLAFDFRVRGCTLTNLRLHSCPFPLHTAQKKSLIGGR